MARRSSCRDRRRASSASRRTSPSSCTPRAPAAASWARSSSATIRRRRRRCRAWAATRGIDLEAVLALRPDLVVAWPNAGSVRDRQPAGRARPAGVPLRAARARGHRDARWSGSACSPARRRAAQGAAARFRARVPALEKRYAGARTVRVFYQIWDRPLLTVNGAARHQQGDAPLRRRERVRGAAADRARGRRAKRCCAPTPKSSWRAARAASRPLGSIPGGASPACAPSPGTTFMPSPPDLIQRHTPRILDGAERALRPSRGGPRKIMKHMQKRPLLLDAA